MTRGPRRHPVGAMATVGLLTVASLAGCITDAPTPPPVVTAAATPDPTASVTTYPLDTAVWYGGFILTFGTATATLDAKGGPITIETTFENSGRH